jgi:hypothetical protein
VKYRSVRSKAEIDCTPSISDGLLGKGFSEVPIIFEAVYLPDDIVAEAESLKHLIKGQKPTGDYS